MRPDELIAAAILAELLGATVSAHDDPALGGGRFDWLLAGRGRRYAVEVTSHNDERRRRFDARTADAGGIYREVEGLAGVYFVRVATTAVPSALWSTVPALIRDHFPDGVDYQALERLRWDPHNPLQVYAQMLSDVGVIWITGQQIPGRSAMQITAEAGWWEHPSAVGEAAASELDKNRDKLAVATNVDERHLFVWIHPSAMQAHHSMHNSEELPSGSLDLGPGIDVLWVAGCDVSRRPLVVWKLWRVASNQPWEDWTPKVRTG